MNLEDILRNVVAIITLCVLSLGSLFAQTSLTLEKAIETGIKNNSDLKQAQYDIDKAQAQVDEVFGNALPSLDLTANFSHALKKQIMPIDFESMLATAVYGVLFKEEVLEYDASKFPTGTNYASLQMDNNFQAQLQLTQILFNSAVFTGIGVSRDYLNVTKSQYNTKLSEVIMNIKSAFYSILYTQSLLDIVNASYENAQNNLNNVKAMASNGLVSEFTLLDAEVRVENIKPQIKQLENTVATATDGLKIVLNMPQNENITIDGKIEYIEEDFTDLESYIMRAKENNWNINTLESAITVNEASVAVSESDYYPTIAGFANYGYNAMSNTLSNWDTYPTSMIGLSLSMNLFKGMQTKYKVQQSRIEVLKAEEQISNVKNAIEMQVKTQMNELNRIKQDIAAQERNVNIAERAYELSTVRFREGEGNQLEILNSDLSLRQAKTNLLESIYNYTISKTKLDNLLGTLPSELIK